MDSLIPPRFFPFMLLYDLEGMEGMCIFIVSASAGEKVMSIYILCLDFVVLFD